MPSSRDATVVDPFQINLTDYWGAGASLSFFNNGAYNTYDKFRVSPQGFVFFGDAWFEMLSDFTTTGASVFDPTTLPPSVHLWRAFVGWMGGLFTLVTATAILAPMNLGGIEVISGRSPGRGADGSRRGGWDMDRRGGL